MHCLINIDVDDIGRATAFYGAAFGLKVGRRFDGGFVELLGGPAPIYLLGKPQGSVAAGEARRDYARHWTPVHLDLVVDDIEAAVAQALAAGATQEREITTHPYGKLCLMADPFGHGFCLLQFVGKGYDALPDSGHAC